MLKSIEKTWNFILDSVFPPRKDFDIVKKLDEKAWRELKEAQGVADMDWVHPIFSYRDNRVRAIIWELKYKENTLPLDHLGKLLYEEIIPVISDISLFDSDAQFILIPIPMTEEGRIERGYNQSEYIAKAILEYDVEHNLLYAPQWFQKMKETTKQSRSQSKEERISNLAGCFEATNQVEGKYVILIDDVVTTGSTLSEARKTLLEKGARDVVAFTIAH